MRWFLEPIERNRFLRLPTVPSNLCSVTFTADGIRGWAVGTGGTIVATVDGGNTWQSQTSGSTAELKSVRFSANGKWGFAVGTGGTIVATVDGGNTWQSQTSGSTADLKSVAISADGKRGFAVGTGGTILATVDGGNTWQSQTSGSTADLKSVAISADGKRGWAVGERGTILASVDGGNTWQSQTSGSTADLESVAISADGKRGWAVGLDRTILATVDGGNSWQSQTSGTTAWLNSVTISADGKRGWAVGSNGTILATVDGGNSWQSQTSGDTAQLNSVTLSADGKRGFAVGSNGTILATVDGGNSWQSQTSGTTAWLNSVTISADGRRAIAGGFYGVIVATVDGGNSWQSQTSDAKPLLNSVTISADGKRGWAVGISGPILATVDGGNTWHSQQSGSRAEWRDLNSVTILTDGKRVWAVGSNGTILATVDGGNTWQSQTSGSKAKLNSVAISADGKRGWAVGSNGTILATVDGGNAWQSQTSGSKAELRSVAISADGKRGWAVGDYGTILATVDGGNTWQSRTSDSKALLSSVGFFADGRCGFAVGHGTILATDDAGNTWTPATYRRSPAPWFYLATAAVLALAVLGLFWNRQPQEPVPSIADKGQTDQPITSIEEDRLGFAELAQGLERYLRNAETRPPLVLGLNAPWGRGKSSVMNMLRTQIERAGSRSVWFNAWHHQKEDVTLAALLASVCEHALPPCLTWLGLRFRTRLLWQRVQRRPWRWLLCLALLLLPLLHPQGATAGAGSLAEQLVDLLPKLLEGNLAAVFSSLFGAFRESPDNFVGSLALLLSLAGVTAVFIYGLRAFPDSPAVLLASVSNRFKVADAKAQTTFRQSFRRDFGDVCQALRPHTLTVFIDDLDRCEPAKTAEMLEAVNYLADSGACFVVLGMAREVVEAQLAHHYCELADARLRVKRVDGEKVEAPADGISQEDRERVAYARKYLHKLINLEIYIPALTDAQTKALLKIATGATKPEGWRARLIAGSRAVAGFWQCHRQAVLWSLSLAAAVSAGWLWIVPGVQQWNRARIQQLEDDRAQAGKQIAALQEAEQQASIALDYAKGRELAATRQVFPQTAVLMAGRKVDVPLGLREHLNEAVDVCDKGQEQGDLAPLLSVAFFLTRDHGEDIVGCWRERAKDARQAEAKLAELVKHRKAAELARKLDDFKQLRRELAEAMAAMAGAERAARLPTTSVAGPVGPNAPPGPKEKGEHAEPAVVYHHDEVPTWPLWLPVAVLLLVALGSVLLAEGDYVIHDNRSFKEAVDVWAPVVNADPELAAPREVKRFMNKARYFAMRLRPNVERRSRLRKFLAPKDVGEVSTKIDEDSIVALTALEHLHPEWFALPKDTKTSAVTVPIAGSLANKLDGTAGEILKKYLNESGSWKRQEQLALFLPLIGEYSSHASSATESKPSPTEPV
jgi:photosystem II stability/assembly factor-like uncharacterized protein